MTVVAPGKVSSELTHIWESLKSLNKTRACLFNLIIYTKESERTAYIKMITKTVVEKFPCRIIFIIENKEKEKLETKVSVISPTPEACDIACDFIEISISNDWQDRISFLVMPHILPDLPICLLWGEDATSKNALLSKLENYVSRVIFDSELSKNLSGFAKTMLEKKSHDHCDIADLNWARTESWRTMLSTTMYTPLHLRMLEQIKSLNIEYNSFSTPFFNQTKIQAIYLQGWLAARLGWEFIKSHSSNEQFSLFYKKGQFDIQVNLLPKAYSQLPSGNILSLEFLTTAEEHAKFSRNVDHPQQIRIEMSSREKCDLPGHYLFSKSHLGLSLVREVCHRGTNSHYLSLLELLEKTDL